MGKTAIVALCCVVHLFGWGDKPHTDITDAALSTIPAEDRIFARLGAEGNRLRMYVHLADWVDSLVEVNENWVTGGRAFPSPAEAFYANDYLLFPASPRPNQHGVPE